MPVDRPLAADLADNLVTLYQQAETRLAADLARRLASGMDSPTWVEDKLRGLTTLRRFSENLVSRLDSVMADEIAQSTILAYIRGGNAAMDDLGRAQSTHPEWLRAAGITNPNDRLRAMIERRQAGVAAQLAQARRALPGADAIARLAFSLTTQLRGTHLRIARWQLDSYREVIAAGSAPEVLLGITTRRRASQIAWEGLLSQGITGFVDRSGRGWNLASYVEMASRSTVAQAAVEGHLDRLGAAGLDLVIVSNAPQECEKCRPWEGKILTRGGPGGRRTVQVEHGTRDGELVDVHVAGSVDQAVSAGLMHPNCRHSLSAYLPGVTRIPTNTEDPEGDKARQQLRALERKVRASKLKAEAAIDPAARKVHEAKTRQLQGQIREHVKATGLIRQPSREQIDLGHRPPPGPVASPPAPPAPEPPPAPSSPPPQPKPAKKAAPKKAAKKPAKTTPPPPSKAAAKAASAKKAPPAKAAKKTTPRKTTPPPPRKAAKAAAPTTTPVTPPSTNARAIADAVNVESSVARADVPHVRAALERQAGLVPSALPRLRAVRSASDPMELQDRGGGHAGTVVAAYDSAFSEIILGDRPFSSEVAEVGRSCSRSGFWVRCPDHLAGGQQVFAHEFGHHVENVMRYSPGGEARQRRFWHAFADELGVARAPETGDGIRRIDLREWLEALRPTIEAQISRYAAGRPAAECFAEIWSEYSTMGDAARPLIRRMGALLQQLMEEVE